MTDNYATMPWWSDENPIGAILMSSLRQGVVFSDGDPARQARTIAERVIKDAWKSGQLPRKEGKQWLVGYDIHMTYFHLCVYPIFCGPAQPARFRDRYIECNVKVK